MSETPHSVEAEQLLLGAILSENSTFDLVSDAPAELFHDPVHQAIFCAIRDRISDGEAVDAIVLKGALSGHAGLQELGGTEYLLRLQMGAVAVSMAKSYALELRRLYARRAGMAALEAAMIRLKQGDTEMPPEKALEIAESGIGEALQAVQTKPLAQPWLAGLFGAVTQINEAYQNERAPGISTGLKRLDQQIGAMGKGELVLLGGRPSMGKTALAWNIALKAALRGEGVFFASLEMRAEALAERALSQIVHDRGEPIPYFKMATGRMDEDQFKRVLEAARGVENLPIFTCDPSCRSLPRLRGAIQAGERSLRAKGAPLSLIVVDYLQLVDPVGRYRAGDTNGRVTAASAAMKAMAMHYEVPVLCLSQLNRSVEMRDPPVPQMSDLRDSGSIEQDADVIMFAYRPEYYTQKQIEAAKGAGKGVAAEADLEAQIASQRNRLTIILAKQRKGPTGSTSVYCDVKNNVVADEAPIQREMEGFA